MKTILYQNHRYVDSASASKRVRFRRLGNLSILHVYRRGRVLDEKEIELIVRNGKCKRNAVGRDGVYFRYRSDHKAHIAAKRIRRAFKDRKYVIELVSGRPYYRF